MRLHAMWDHHDGGNLSHFLEGLAEAVEKEAWLQLGLSFQEFISSPAPDGLDIPLEQFKAAYHIRHRKEKYFPTAAEYYSKMRKKVLDQLNPELPKPTVGDGNPGPGRGNKTVNNVNRLRGGNSETYALRRLKRDRPDLADKVLDGELSANAAAIEAGFRKRTITVTLEPRSIARTLARHLSEDQINDLIVALAGGAR